MVHREKDTDKMGSGKQGTVERAQEVWAHDKWKQIKN